VPVGYIPANVKIKHENCIVFLILFFFVCDMCLSHYVVVVVYLNVCVLIFVFVFVLECVLLDFVFVFVFVWVRLNHSHLWYKRIESVVDFGVFTNFGLFYYL